MAIKQKRWRWSALAMGFLVGVGASSVGVLTAIIIWGFLAGHPLKSLAIPLLLASLTTILGFTLMVWAIYRGSNPKPNPQVTRWELWGALLTIIGLLQAINLFLYSQLYNWVVHLNSRIDQLYGLLK